MIDDEFGEEYWSAMLKQYEARRPETTTSPPPGGDGPVSCNLENPEMCEACD